MHPHLNQPVSKSQNSEITEFKKKKKNVQILTFIFYHSGGGETSWLLISGF